MKNFALILSAALLFLFTAHTVVKAQRIAVTLAGNGSGGFTGDNGPARYAAINGPVDVCVDAAQNIYFADQTNNRVRKLSAVTGVVTTIAGGGTSAADGVPAITASLSPNYLCMGAGGNLYVSTASQIRVINLATGIITTIAGSADSPGDGGDGGLATAAMLNSPEGICIDSAGNLYVADRWNSRIREINAATGVISTIAGTGTAGYGGDGRPATVALLQDPISIAINAAGDIYFSDQETTYPFGLDASYIRKISAATGIISTIAGTAAYSGITYGVPALSTELGTITGMCADSSGNIFCDEMSCSCRELDMATDTFNLIAGNFDVEGFTDDTNCLSANLSIPMGLCLGKAGEVYVADYSNNRIRKLIQLSHAPTFAFGHGQFINPVLGSENSIDSLLWITDLDAAQLETWTVITLPSHGTLSGFPAEALSGGTLTTAKPTGLYYFPLASYAGEDQFRVRVSDGLLSDTMTIYVGPSSLTQSVKNTITGPASIDIFPNPALSVLNIRWANVQAPSTSVIITDVTGRVVYNTMLQNNASNTGTAQIDISPIPTGVYFARVNGTDVRKFVKE